MLAKGNLEGYILAFTVLLFLGGLVRAAFVGQARFRDASRLRHEAERLAAEMEVNSRQDHLTAFLTGVASNTLSVGSRLQSGPSLPC
ncbi:hypothetical protein AJ88_46550 [Mesorhizobium amorphae CCBAU 01583]|nr:hypothetical protein AJ88_46550 [Mesorhizobium amorphae CCBAU 01583]